MTRWNNFPWRSLELTGKIYRNINKDSDYEKISHIDNNHRGTKFEELAKDEVINVETCKTEKTPYNSDRSVMYRISPLMSRSISSTKRQIID